MKISTALCDLWLSLYFAALVLAKFSDASSESQESCLHEACERSHALTEQFSDQYVVEQQGSDVKERIVLDQETHHSENTLESHNFIHSSNVIDENKPYDYTDSDYTERSQTEATLVDTDKVKLENLEGFLENVVTENVELKSDMTDDIEKEKDISQSSEPDEDDQHATELPELEVVGMNKINSDKESNDNTFRKENIEPHLEQPLSRRRYFPLLYTIRTLVNSLLSEFGDDSGNQEPSFNTSDAATGNLTTPEDRIKNLNATTNGTDLSRKTRFQCAVKNVTNITTGEVKIVNSTELLEILNFSKNQKVSACVLVMFYAPWCHFCARAAPHYNALAKAFPQLDVLAVDTSHFSYLNARFGTVAVPNLMLFYARSAVRFNHTVRILENFIQFVTNNTGLEPDKTVKVEPANFLGPLPSVVVQGQDWLLWLAWTFVIICSAYGFMRSQYGQSFITWMRVSWQEHQHIE